ncbi:MAG: transglutaminase family protein [Lachnospiraceae bacterium]|nr:transglutaminase family protein [Lachnospiraceae bacterium]
MKDLRFHYHMDIEFSEPVCNHTYTLKCIPQTTQTQEITECTVQVLPANKVQRGCDSFGNIMLYGNVEEEQTLFSVDVSGRARTGIERQEIGGRYTDLSIYKYQTPLTRPDSRLEELYQKCAEDKTAELSLAEKVRAYMKAVYESMSYCKGVTGIATTAGAALSMGKGVCQDYAHILLSLCRMDRIPARYVVGMLLGEGESHAWVEIFDGARWMGFDPTNDLVAGDSHIKISHGRDYQDCSINRGVFTGQAKQQQRILVEVTETEGASFSI